jgi:ATP-dependent Clp protease ATP-binding subunit ClpA
LQRVIKTKLQNPLAEALLQGDFTDGDMIRVGCDKTADKLVFDVDTALASAS